MFARLFGVVSLLIIGGAVVQLPVVGWSGVAAACFTVFLILIFCSGLEASPQRAHRPRRNRPAHCRKRAGRHASHERRRP